MKPAAVLLLLLTASCGYRVSGRGDAMPKTLKTIAIPSFGNATTRYKLADRLPAALTREFISRTRYLVVADPNDADAILTGAVLGYNSYPTIFDPVTGRAAGVQVIVNLQLRLTERATSRVLYARDNYEARARYEISTDQVAFFDEGSAALDRLASEVSRMVVSSVLENF
jgi:hypothetical protein